MFALMPKRETEDKMKRLATIALFALLAGALSAETILICHAQTLPATLEKGFSSKVSQTLVEMVFDSLFDNGDIAFDTGMQDATDEPTAAYLSTLSRNYGADKVVYFRVFWKAGEEKEVLLDRVTYSLVGPKGNVLNQGSVQGKLVAASGTEAKDTRTLGNQLVSSLKL